MMRKYYHEGIKKVAMPGWVKPTLWAGLGAGGVAAAGGAGYLATKNYLENNLDKHIEKGAKTFANSLLESETGLVLKQSIGSLAGGGLGALFGKQYANSPTAGMLAGSALGYGIGSNI